MKLYAWTWKLGSKYFMMYYASKPCTKPSNQSTSQQHRDRDRDRDTDTDTESKTDTDTETEKLFISSPEVWSKKSCEY